MSKSRIFKSLAEPKVGKYVAHLVGGAVLSELAEHMMPAPQEPRPPQPPAGPHDSFGQAKQALQQRRATLTETLPTTRFVQSLDPRRWEVPTEAARVAKVAHYAATSSTAEMAQDAKAAARKKAVEAATELVTQPGADSFAKARKAASVAIGVMREGPAQIAQDLQEHAQLESASGLGQVGFNMMMKAPLMLVPGPLGAAARTYMNLNLAGNLGRQVNDFGRALGGADGLPIAMVEQRESTHAAAHLPPIE